MALSMFFAGHRMEEVRPLEVTVQWTRANNGKTGYAVAELRDDGSLAPMIPDWAAYEICIYQTAAEAWRVAESYADRYRGQGLDVVIRRDLQN